MIQYIIAAGLGALVGSAQRKGKKFAMGGTTGDAEERAFAEYMDDYGVDREEADEQFLGEFDNKKQWAAEFVDDTGGMESLIDPERFYRIDKVGFRQFAQEEADSKSADIDEDNAEEYAEKLNLEIEYEDAVEADKLDDFIQRLQEEEEAAVYDDFMANYTTADEIINDLGPNYGMGLDGLERAYLIMPDYDEVADALEDDGYVFIEKDFKTFVFNPNMARGGKTQGYDDKLDESLGSRKGAGSTKEQSRKDRRDESAAMEKSMGRRKYAAVGTMDMGDRMMAEGGMLDDSKRLLIEAREELDVADAIISRGSKGFQGVRISLELAEKAVVEAGGVYKYKSILEPIESAISALNRGELSYFRKKNQEITEEESLDIIGKSRQQILDFIGQAQRAIHDATSRRFAHGGKTQGYDDKLDESLGSRKGAERTKKQSRKDRRDESAAMEKSMGRRKYASVGTMDKGSREMEKGGRITAPQPILDGKEFIALVVDKDGMPQMKFSKTFNGALRMAKNMTKKFDTGAYHVKKFDPFYGASFLEAGLFIEPTKSFGKGGKTKKRKEVSDFDKLAMKVAARYRAEGKSNKEAMEIGRGTAANVARQQQAKKGKK